MIAIGRYFVFMISVTATMSSPINNDNNYLVDFLIHIITLHNNVRERHGVQELLFDETLSNAASDIRHNRSISDNIGWNKGYGVLRSASDLNYEEASRIFYEWYNTGVGYDYENEPSADMAVRAAPFTQIVWKTTINIGISIAGMDDGTYDVIVAYSPKGNQINQYQDNVFFPNYYT